MGRGNLPAHASSDQRPRQVRSRVTPRTKGLVITLAGVLILSPASVLIRLASTDPWIIVLWQGVLVAVVLTAARVLNSGLASLAIGRLGLIAAGLFAIDHILFVMAITHTNVANVLVILAITPLFVIMGNRVFLREPVERRTWLAVVAGIIGVAVIVAGSVTSSGMTGNVAALGAAVSMAGAIVALRKARSRDMVQALSLGALISAVVGLPFAFPMTLEASQIGYLLLFGGVVVPVSFYLIFLGPRFITAPEVSLIMLVETALGPMWVWLVTNEEPTPEAFIGGSIVVGAIIIHSLVSLRRYRAPPPGDVRSQRTENTRDTAATGE